MAVNHPHFGTFCEICFTGLTPSECATDTNGDKWDVCKGECATQAGITEPDTINELRTHKTVTPTTLDIRIQAVIDAYQQIGNRSMGAHNIAARFTRLYQAIDALAAEQQQ